MINFKKTIETINPTAAIDLAEKSVFNHHVRGLHYFCLQRRNEMTLKIYWVPRGIDGYLVAPHNHRYDFLSIVLHGHVDHFRFKKYQTGKFLGAPNYNEYKYDWERKCVNKIGECNLDDGKMESHDVGEKYHVDVNEIHTLRIIDGAIIGIVQERDINDDSRLYLRDWEKFQIAPSHPMDVHEYLGGLKFIYEILDLAG